MIAHGLQIYIALEPVDMRLGFERLGAIVRQRMACEPPTKALFAFVNKRGHTMKVLTWDGTGVVLVHKKLDCGKFVLPMATRQGEEYVVVSDAIFDVIFKGISKTPRMPRRRLH